MSTMPPHSPRPHWTEFIRRCRELGQGSIEYIGIACVAAVIIAGLASFPFGEKISAGLGRTICGIFSSTSAQGTLPPSATAIQAGKISIDASSCPLAQSDQKDSAEGAPQSYSDGRQHNIAPAAAQKSTGSKSDSTAKKSKDSGSESGSKKAKSSSGTKADVSPQGFEGPFTKGDDGFIYDGDGEKVPYSNPKKRPSYGEDQVKDVWERDRAQQLDDIENGDLEVDESGFVPEKLEKDEMYVMDKDGNWRSITWKDGQSRAGKWDMGHLPGHEFRKLHKKYLDGDISKEEFLKEYQDPANYKVEDPGRNQSHMDEDTSDEG